MFKKATNYAKAFESEELYQRQRAGASRERAAISHQPAELWSEQPLKIRTLPKELKGGWKITQDLGGKK